MASNDHTRIGTIAKTHGVRGELIIRTADPLIDLKEDWESIFLQIEGILVPFFISSLRPFKAGEWVVKLDWYDDRTAAESLMGHSVWVSSGQVEEGDDELYLDELVGYRISDTTSGREGVITEFMDIAENPVFEAEIDGEKVLLPAREEFILEFDPGKKTIIFELPEGIF